MTQVTTNSTDSTRRICIDPKHSYLNEANEKGRLPQELGLCKLVAFQPLLKINQDKIIRDSKHSQTPSLCETINHILQGGSTHAFEVVSMYTHRYTPYIALVQREDVTHG